MTETWHVLLQGSIYSEHESEAEAVSAAKDILYDLRAEAQNKPWEPAVETLAVSKVMYEVRVTDNDPKARRCDFQLFPMEELPEDVAVHVVECFGYDRNDIPCVLQEITEQFAQSVAETKDKAALEAILAAMPANQVSMFAIDEIRWYNEDMPCDDGFLRWRAKGPRVFGKLYYLEEDAPVWEEI